MRLYDEHAATIFQSELYFNKSPRDLYRIRLKHDEEETMIKKLFVVGIGLMLLGRWRKLLVMPKWPRSKIPAPYGGLRRAGSDSLKSVSLRRPYEMPILWM